MTRSALVISLLLGVWIAGTAGFAFWQFGPKVEVMGFQTRSVGSGARHSAGSIGRSREQVLVEVSQRYRTQTGVLPSAIASGEDYAPVSFLNSELERLGAKWRVKSADGLDVKVYDIS